MPWHIKPERIDVKTASLILHLHQEAEARDGSKDAAQTEEPRSEGGDCHVDG